MRTDACAALIHMIRPSAPGGGDACLEHVTACIAKRLGHEDHVIRTCALEAFKDPSFYSKSAVTSTLLRHLEDSPDGYRTHPASTISQLSLLIMRSWFPPYHGGGMRSAHHPQ